MPSSESAAVESLDFSESAEALERVQILREYLHKLDLSRVSKHLAEKYGKQWKAKRGEKEKRTCFRVRLSLYLFVCDRIFCGGLPYVPIGHLGTVANRKIHFVVAAAVVVGQRKPIAAGQAGIFGNRHGKRKPGA